MYVEAYETLSKKCQTMRSVVMFVATACVLFLIKLRWPKKNSFYDMKSYRFVHCEDSVTGVEVDPWLGYHGYLLPIAKFAVGHLLVHFNEVLTS